MADDIAKDVQAGVAPEPPVPVRNVFAFFAMVLGMFMAILDIQIVSASLSKSRPVLARVRTKLPGCRPPISWPKSS